MPTGKTAKPRVQGPAAAAPRARADRAARRRRLTLWAVALVAAAALLAVLYAVFDTSRTGSSAGGGPRFDVGTPGPGKSAPAFSLRAGTGKEVSLADYQGESVLLYFQEGLTCQPCWDQITDLEKNTAQLKAAGIDAVVSITTDPADLIARKTGDMGLTTPVLSDPDLAVSQSYQANQYGMMGTPATGTVSCSSDRTAPSTGAPTTAAPPTTPCRSASTTSSQT